MIPGELFPADGTLVLNAGQQAVTLMVANTGDRPVQVGSHYHFGEANSRLWISTGTAARRNAVGHRCRDRCSLRARPAPRSLSDPNRRWPAEDVTASISK